jgi:hypothetical protein
MCGYAPVLLPLFEEQSLECTAQSHADNRYDWRSLDWNAIGEGGA